MADAATVPADAGDERLAFRGPIQRLLTRPEIGALIGALGVWALFWLVGGNFGTAGATANFLDVAATLGIMSVAVALLMIGGEFDLSSGSMTGATGMLVLLMTKEVGELGGAGLSFHIAVPLTLMFALGIGWFNGFVVERTGLPSFIVTLATFFILIGGKLGFAKRLTQKIIVQRDEPLVGTDEFGSTDGSTITAEVTGVESASGVTTLIVLLVLLAVVLVGLIGYQRLKGTARRISGGASLLGLAGIGATFVAYATSFDDTRVIETVTDADTGQLLQQTTETDPAGWNFWHGVFAGRWIAKDHIWEGRDTVWAILVIVGAALLVLGTIFMTYQRREHMSTSRGAVALAGAAAGIIGFVLLLSTDGVSANTIWGLVTAAGCLVGIVGLGMMWFMPAQRRAGAITRRTKELLLGGTMAIVVGAVVGMLIDSDDSSSLGFVGGAAGRTIFFIGMAVWGILALGVAAGRLKDVFPVIGVLILIVPSISFLVTVQGARAILFTGFAIGGAVALLSAAGRARSESGRAGLGIGLYTAAVLFVIALIIRAEGTGRQIRVELFTTVVLIAFLVALAGVLTYLFQQRVGPDVETDRKGRRATALGALLLIVALALRLLFVTQDELDAGLGGIPLRISVVWFIAMTVGATLVLQKTKFGSWIFAVGGNKDAARSVGVPAARTKTSLFMIVSGASWLVGMLTAFRFESVQANVGDGLEFRYIIAAVVGGNLLTGGYGSTVGAAIGAVIWAMISSGIGFAGWDTNWQFLILGALLLGAVLVNNAVRQRALRS